MKRQLRFLQSELGATGRRVWIDRGSNLCIIMPCDWFGLLIFSPLIDRGCSGDGQVQSAGTDHGTAADYSEC